MSYFPTEILENIFLHCDACDLGRVAQTCKDWNAIVYGRMWRGVFPKMIREQPCLPANFPMRALSIPNASGACTLSATLIDQNNVLSLQHQLLYTESGPIHRTKMVECDLREEAISNVSELEGVFNHCVLVGNTLFLATKNAIYTRKLKDRTSLTLLWEETEEENGHITTLTAKGSTVAWTVTVPFSHTKLRIFELPKGANRTIRYDNGIEVKQVLIDLKGNVYTHIIAPNEISFVRISMDGSINQALLYGVYNNLFLDHEDKLQIFFKGMRLQEMVLSKIDGQDVGFIIQGMWANEEIQDVEPITKDRIAFLSMNNSNQILLLRIVDTFRKKIIWTKCLGKGKTFSSLKLHATAGKVLAIADSQFIIYTFS